MTREEKAAYDKIYRLKNKDKIAAQNKQWQLDNPEKSLAIKRKYYPTRNQKRDVSKIRDYNLQRNYNITLEDYNNMYASQCGKCVICDMYNAKLFVDHNHTTGKVRQLLCLKCNSGLGMFNDNSDIILKAWNYIREHNGENFQGR